jgi:hypothetical protein
LMAVLYAPGVDPSRLYYGTDTRAAGLLMGAALALAWTPNARTTRGFCPAARRSRLKGGNRDGSWARPLGRLRHRWGWTLPVWLDVIGLVALGVLVLFCLRLGEFQPFLYRGGLAAVSIATAVLIMALAHPYTHLGGSGLLGLRPLRWIGERSYGIYLWHWPVYMVTRPQIDVPIDGLSLLALRLGATVLLADLSYRYVETPVRVGTVGRSWRSLREARGFKRWDLAARWIGAAVPALALCVALGIAVVHAKPPEPPDYLSTDKVRIEASNKTLEPNNVPKGATDTRMATAQEPALEEKAASATDAANGGAPAGAPVTTVRGTEDVPDAGSSGGPPTGTVAAIGDSAMLGAIDVLRREIPTLTIIDARGSRQAPEAIGILQQLSASGKLGDMVIVHIGNNGYFAAEHFDEMMRALEGTRKVLVVNVTVPDGKSWVPNNEVLADGVRRYPDRAVLVDWYAASAGHPEYFSDGIHLTPRGARAYANLIAAAYEGHGR